MINRVSMWAILCMILVAIAGAYAIAGDTDEDHGGDAVDTTDDTDGSGSDDGSSDADDAKGSDGDQTKDDAKDDDSSDDGKTDDDAKDDSGSGDDQTKDDDSSDDQSGDASSDATYTITYTEGTACHTVSVSDGETVITFSGATSDIVVSISGVLNGSIVIDVGDDYDFELDLEGVTITSYSNAPIDAESADKVTISAKKNTENYIYDYREAVTDDAISSAVYAKMDLDIQGKGSLAVVSTNNNGIHSKDDLTVKNLTLTVTCQDNALKGNDSVTIQSGTVTLTAYSGDGIKTTNSELKTKDDGTTEQQGNVYINTDKGDLTLTIYYADDAIDAASEVYTEETEGNTLTMNTYPLSSDDDTADGGDSTDDSSSDSDDATYTITYTEGEICHTVSSVDGETVITFSGATSDIVVSIAGVLNGSIVIDIGDDYDFELDLEGVTITSYNSAPIDAESADDLTISAKKNTENYIYDYRDAVTDDDAISSAVYATMDLDIQGKGSLTVVSTNNNGIHSKDDLTVKNLTLTVTCQDNALKGNDSVELQSGTVTLTASAGDGIKTSNYELKTKDDGTTKQLGNVYVDTDKGDLTLTIYAANDGIDAAYGVYISETEGNKLTLTIYAGSYATSSTTGSDTTLGAGMGPGQNGNGGMPGQNGGSNNGGFPGQNGNGGFPGQPGQDDNQWDYDDSNGESMKGIKGDYLVEISGGTIAVYSTDDSIHSNGYVTISGGDLTLTSGDDGVHADGALTVSGGTIGIVTCYEGLEGSTVAISGGDISITASDDGVNSTGTSGTGISISGGTLYVYSGGDSLDSNSYTSYQGVVISGGYTVLISNGASDTAIDTERGYTYTGGYVLGISQGGGMSSENTYCSNFSSVGKSASVSASKGSYLTVTVGGTVVASVLMPTSISNASAIYLGSSFATISTSSTSSLTYDSDGVYWS